MVPNDPKRPGSRRFDEEPTRRRARKSEKAAAKALGGKLTPNSGAGRIKGDVQTGCFVVEVKQTEARQYTLKRSTLTKLSIQAGAKIPVLVVDFRGGQDGGMWAMLPVEYLEVIFRDGIRVSDCCQP